MFVDLDDEERWLKRSDQSSAWVRIQLLETRAARMMRDGKRAEADETLARVVTFYDRTGAHDAVAANNAAMSLMGRYAATGDLAHIRGAVSRLEGAARL